MRPPVVVVFLTSALLALAACGSSGSGASSSGGSGSGGSSGSAAGGSSSAASPVSHASHKPCALITDQDANTALHVTMKATTTNHEDGIEAACVYADQQGHRVQLTVKNDAVTTKQLTMFASHDATTVPGVGDLTYWNDNQDTLYTVARGVELNLGVFDDQNTMSAAQVQAAATSLMKQAVDRL